MSYLVATVLRSGVQLGSSQNNCRMSLLLLLHDTRATFAPEEFTPVPSHGSIFVYMIPLQNVMPTRVTPAWVHPGCCTRAKISLRYEISQRYHVNAKRPHVSVWDRSVGRLERVAHALCLRFWITPFSSPEPLGLIWNPTTCPRNDGLWGREWKHTCIL